MSEPAKVAIAGIIAALILYGLLAWQRVSIAQASADCMAYSGNVWNVANSTCATKETAL